MGNKNDIQEKILDRIRKLIRLKRNRRLRKKRRTNAVMQVNRLLKEYNLSLLDIDDRQPEEKFRGQEIRQAQFQGRFRELLEAGSAAYPVQIQLLPDAQIYRDDGCDHCRN